MIRNNKKRLYGDKKMLYLTTCKKCKKVYKTPLKFSATCTSCQSSVKNKMLKSRINNLKKKQKQKSYMVMNL